MRCRVYALFAWVTTLVFILAAWVVMLFAEDQWKLAFLLGGTGCAMSAVAATLHIRSFIVRICSLVRATNGLSVDEGVPRGVRPIR